ncbi:membrane dipeptidase [Geosmithia morbida]|uniref:Dipeptidase n=1 Tax=Geosmithia morbida TaxID=1094350 RepID=A0A9P5CYA0_9HYPO|nr:membrane dipeptidase [Geosmithia morbida]KAF4120168.1 membrane dipeptidase [Geosmithia morbida]
MMEPSSEKGSVRLPVRAKAGSITPRRLLAVAVLFLVTVGFMHKSFGQCYHRLREHICGPLSVEERAERVLKTTPLIDGHVDMPLLFRYFYHNQIDNDDVKQAFENGTFPGHIDIKRLREGISGGSFWSLYAPCPEHGDDFSDENLAASVQFTLDQIDVMTRLQEIYPDDFSPAKGLYASNALDAWKKGQFISPLGIEGLHQIGNKAANLRRFYDLGVRYATLTHNCHNKYADAALLESPFRKAEPLHHGVSPEGRSLIHEMNRIGMIVDISHVSDDTMIDVLGGNDSWEGSKAPVIYSHSSAYAICPHPRNVKDHILQMVKGTNSVVMVNISPDFISCKDTGADNGVPEFAPEDSTLDRVVDHITYIGDLIGYAHVGIGTDFDGISSTPEGLEDASKYRVLVAELLRRGVSEEDAGKVVGGNVLRVWTAVDAVAAKLQTEGAPVLEDRVELKF